MRIEVAFALSGMQVLEVIELEDGARVGDAVAVSGLSSRFPDEQIDALPVGIWGHVVARDHALKDGDRVEIYRPLEMDPREARRQRSGASS